MSDTPNSEPPSSLQRFRAEALGRGIPSEDVDRWLELGRPCAVLSRDEDELRGKLRLKPCVSLPNHEIADDEVTVDTAEHPRAEELREVWEEIWGEERRVSKWSQLQIGGRRAERSARR